MLQPFSSSFAGKRVFVTGHTGFKGAWLCEWLLQLGATVTGFSLPPPTTPSLFQQLHLERRLTHIVGDVRDRGLLKSTLDTCAPDFVFHLAAQALVRESYTDPAETFNVNVMGTVNVLEALRHWTRPCAAVFVITDKCYENREWLYGYRENDPLGGHDPYSASKAAADIAVAAYRNSFFHLHPVRIASTRAGNVIGGGDWALHRIVPDAMRSLSRGEAIPVRNKSATRPWQHVLEPLSGYLSLAAKLAAAAPEKAHVLSSAFNFGPGLSSNRTVSRLVEEILKHRPGNWIDQCTPNAVHEASLLNLATDKAHHLLDWSPIWNFEQTIAETVAWYLAVEKGADPVRLTHEQIAEYEQAAAAASVAWAFPVGGAAN